MSRKTRELEARVVELENKLDNINRNMEYISSKIHTAVQVELDEAWQRSIENYEKQLKSMGNSIGDEEC